ncbi:hypothetical protein [Desulfurispora thermophila]|uniref:hypothetical protein n=1 Tax=Desulfurispora thermophila TaxID=265470 RepID=UPI000363632B|nr:hypothetical protein [Desulfurispora thermophila]
MPHPIDIDRFVQKHQVEIETLVNLALNKAGRTVENKMASGEVSPRLTDVLPLLLYEALLTSTVATLRLVAEMVNESARSD